MKVAIITANTGSLESVAKQSSILHATTAFGTTVSAGVVAIGSEARCENITRFVMWAGTVSQKPV